MLKLVTVIQGLETEDRGEALKRQIVRSTTDQACYDMPMTASDASYLLESDGGLLHFDGGSYSHSADSIGAMYPSL